MLSALKLTSTLIILDISKTSSNLNCSISRISIFLLSFSSFFNTWLKNIFFGYCARVNNLVPVGRLGRCCSFFYFDIFSGLNDAELQKDTIILIRKTTTTLHLHYTQFLHILLPSTRDYDVKMLNSFSFLWRTRKGSNFDWLYVFHEQNVTQSKMMCCRRFVKYLWQALFSARWN